MAQLVVPSWLVALAGQVGVCACVLAPGAVLAQALREPPATSKSPLAGFVRAMFFGVPLETPAATAKAGADRGKAAPGGMVSTGPPATPTLASYVFCATGLMLAYLPIGVLQEKLMSNEYATGRLESSTFVVFCNRFASCLGAAAVLLREQGGLHTPAPLYMFSSVAVANVLSSWCQLEALKHVNFPTQVLAKSSKLIPVMLFGRVFVGKRYARHEYIIALCMCVGTTLFMLSQRRGRVKADTGENSLSGYVLLLLYLGFNSTLSQTQGFLFSKYKMSSYQMMFGINLFCAGFAFISLAQTGELVATLAFMRRNPDCIVHMLLFSALTVVGQSFVFHTVKVLGPVFFTMIMTARVILSMLLSCLVFGHAVDGQGTIGACLVFGSLGFQVWCKLQRKQQQQQQKAGQGKDKDA